MKRARWLEAAVVALACLGPAPAPAQQPPPAPEEERQRRNREQWEKLTPEEKQRLRKEYERLRNLPERERRRLQERERLFRQLEERALQGLLPRERAALDRLTPVERAARVRTLVNDVVRRDEEELLRHLDADQAKEYQALSADEKMDWVRVHRPQIQRRKDLRWLEEAGQRGDVPAEEVDRIRGLDGPAMRQEMARVRDRLSRERERRFLDQAVADGLLAKDEAESADRLSPPERGRRMAELRKRHFLRTNLLVVELLPPETRRDLFEARPELFFQQVRALEGREQCTFLPQMMPARGAERLRRVARGLRPTMEEARELEAISDPALRQRRALELFEAKRATLLDELGGRLPAVAAGLRKLPPRDFVRELMDRIRRP